MSKGKGIILGVLGGFLIISLLHVWLNIGFNAIIPRGAEVALTSQRVGFLPVT